jgi:hypothetical protein
MTDAVPGTLDFGHVRQWLYELRDRLPMFVIYDHPSDRPDFYVARLWLSLPEPAASGYVIMDPDLERLQESMASMGLTKLMPQEGDDPVILETWL